MHPFSTAALVVFFLYKITIRFHEFALALYTQTDVEHNAISRFKEHVWCVRGSKIMEWQSAEWIMLEWLRCISFDCAPTSARLAACLPATISLTKSNLPKESRFLYFLSFTWGEAARLSRKGQTRLPAEWPLFWQTHQGWELKEWLQNDSSCFLCRSVDGGGAAVIHNYVQRKQ